jgi:hypothetical protein
MLDARKAVVGLTAVGQGLVAAGSDLTDPWPLGHLFRAVAEDARVALVTGNVTMSAASCAQPPCWKGPRPGAGSLPSSRELRLGFGKEDAGSRNASVGAQAHYTLAIPQSGRVAGSGPFAVQGNRI